MNLTINYPTREEEMPIFQMIANKLTERRFAKLSQTQNEALIDTLVAAKVIDGQILPEEQQELVEVIAMLTWDGARSTEGFFQGSIERARGLQPTPDAL